MSGFLLMIAIIILEEVAGLELGFWGRFAVFLPLHLAIVSATYLMKRE